jgi:hypothetical protein
VVTTTIIRFLIFVIAVMEVVAATFTKIIIVIEAAKVSVTVMDSIIVKKHLIFTSTITIKVLTTTAVVII